MVSPLCRYKTRGLFLYGLHKFLGKDGWMLLLYTLLPATSRASAGRDQH